MKKCDLPHKIRPVLLAFHSGGLDSSKDFVTKNVGAWGEESMEAYLGWLMAAQAGGLPNHVLLYWWLMKFREAS
jgi:hypothetical protein